MVRQKAQNRRYQRFLASESRLDRQISTENKAALMRSDPFDDLDEQYVDTKHTAELRDDEIGDILPEDRGGNYILVPDEKDDIESLGGGYYRVIGKSGKVMDVFERRGPTEAGSGDSFLVPVKALSAKKKADLKAKLIR